MRLAILVASLGLVVAAVATPNLPTINGYDFNVGAHNSDGTIEYRTHGVSADTLTFVPNAADHEVTTLWPNWPAGPTYPVWSAAGMPNFGGDFALSLRFTEQDAPYVGPGGTLGVSLVGGGANPEGADLEIYGTVYDLLGQTFTGLLWSMEVSEASLYGFEGAASYGLDGVGPITGGLIAEAAGLVGQPGAFRGHLDFINAPSGWMPYMYDPVSDADYAVRASFSGEVGVVPEPAALGLLLVFVGLCRRR